jgi:hypothetical protein
LAGACSIAPNGAAIWGGCVPEYSGWRTFCRPGTNFIEHYECRDTSMIGAANLSPVTKLMAGTGPEYSGVQTVSKAVIYHGAGFQLRADARVRVQ